MQNKGLLSRRRWAAIPLALLLALVMSTGLAFAGSVKYDDQANLLSSSDRTAIQNAASRVNWNIYVWTTTSYTNQNQFADAVRSRSTDQNGVVIGINKGSSGGFTYVAPGSSKIGLTSTEASQAADAGDASFKQGQWGAGVSAIISRIGALSGAPSSSGSSSSQPVSNSGGSGFGAIACLVIGLIVLVAGSMFFFRRRGNVGPSTMVQQPGPNYGPGYGPGPGYAPGPGYGPNYGPGYGPGYGGGGGSGLGAGLGGAALGGLVGYELGKNAGENNAHGGNYVPGGGSTWDAGNSGDTAGGGSTWDAGNSGGSDWGSSGGGSDWGGNASGGSFDVGGGGGDWGGGGGDSGGGGGDSW
jgi:hypothetical protein